MAELISPPTWMEQAACNTADPADFFRESTARATKRAKAVCAVCAVIDSCLTFALDGGDEYGVYGGLTPKERAGLPSETEPCPNCGRAFGVRGMRTHLTFCGTDRPRNLNAPGTTAKAPCGVCGVLFETRGLSGHEDACGQPKRSSHGSSCRCGDERCRAAHAAERRRQRHAVSA